MSEEQVDKELVFEVEINDQKRPILARKPTLQEHNEGQKVYNRAFKDAITSGAILRSALEDRAREQGIWDDDKQQKLIELGKAIHDDEEILKKGGIKKSVAKEVALRIFDNRTELMRLVAKKNILDENTVEAQAENAKFNYFVSACLVYNDTKKPVFKDMADYYNQSEKPWAITCAVKLSNLLYGIKEDYFESLPERQFLEQYGYTKDGKFVDEQGRLTDRSGRLVNELGEFINEQGQRVDVNGTVIEEVEFSPFLDDDDKPIVLDSPKKSKSKTGE